MSLVGALAISLPVASPVKASLDISDSPNSVNAPAPRATVKSGNLGGDKVFTLPPPGTTSKYGQAPFPVPTGKNVKSLPGSKVTKGTGLDIPSSYIPQTSCDPAEKAGVKAFKLAVLDSYKVTKDWGSSRECAHDGVSEHLEGRAWDWNADATKPGGFAAAGSLLYWLTKDKGLNAKRLGIMYIGYNHRIWASYREKEGWRYLNNSNKHVDHVHFSFSWRGATKQTTFWKNKVYKQDFGPCKLYNFQPAPIRTGPNLNSCSGAKTLPTKWQGKPVIWRGSTGATVKRIQSILKVKQDSTFGASTQAAVRAFQIAKRIPATGAVDAQTWFALGLSGTPTVANVAAKKKSYVRLKQGNRGTRVLRLQTKLRLSKKYRTGYFGSTTKKAVKKKQRAYKYRATGVATAGFQRRLKV